MARLLAKFAPSLPAHRQGKLPTRHLALALALTLTLTLTPTAKAAVLLEIDVSNPAAVVIRATDNSPAVSFSTINNYHGITLRDLLPTDAVISGLVPSSTLTARDAADSYNEWWITDLGTGRINLNLYFNPEADATAQNFNSAQPAFTGIATLDMSAAILPAIGHTGNIVMGDATETGPTIGQFTVIPEPSTLLLLATAPLLALLRRRGLPRSPAIPATLR